MNSRRTGTWVVISPVALGLLALMAACSALGPVPAATPPTPTATATQAPHSSPAATPTPSPWSEPRDPDGNHIATGLAIARIVSADSPRTEVFVVQPDGSMRQVTNVEIDNGAGGARPIWSPDGLRIAFGPSSLGSTMLPAMLVVDSDGTNQRVVQQFDVEEFSIGSWSSDGRYLVFSDSTPPGDRRLWLADIPSGEVTRIGTGAGPRWLPGDRQIAFLQGVAGLVPGDPQALTAVMYVMNRDDLTPQFFAEADAATWSPDGSQVLIEKGGGLLLAEADGANPRRIAAGAQPVWSPDGSRFVYLSGTDADGRPLLTLMDRDGRRLWTDVLGGSPSWSGDGSRLAVGVVYPELLVRVLDAATGDALWETSGAHPNWRP